ncbi:MAG: hypothetical protein J3R72DRAFT_476137 [Linnemannia gamsii]|nr:MAG: hypothetical protein J3R72DRAFT_476137 [Linnemannia gamsii]
MQPTWLLLLTSTLLLSSHHTSFTSTYAQIPPASPFTPKPLYYSQSVFIERQKLFIHGGLDRETTTPQPSSQTFYIDLSVPWPASQPTCKKLAEGTAAMGITTALSNNKSVWYSFYSGSVSRLNINSGTWEPFGKLANLNAKDDLPAFVDPATNQLYVVNGYYDPSRNFASSARYDASASSPQLLSDPQKVELLGAFTATWSTVMKVALIVGGFTSTIGTPIAQNTMYTYNPILPIGDLLQAVKVFGTIPTARYDHCMVEAYNGTKMILFGGYGAGKYLDDIYILEIATMKWTKGTSGGPTVARRRASCAVTNDLFVAWGGAVEDPAVSSMTAVGQNITIVYNLITNQWQDTYSPDPYVPPPPPTVTTPPKSGTGGGGGGGAGGAVPTGADGEPLKTSMPTTTIIGIAGGVAAFVLVVAIGFAIFCCRRRRQRSEVATTTKSRDIKDGGEKGGSSAATAAAAAAASAGGGGGGNTNSVFGAVGRKSESAPRALNRGPSNLYSSTRSSSDAGPQPLYMMKPVPGPRYPAVGSASGPGSASGSGSLAGTSTFGTLLRPAHPRYSVASTVSVAVGMPLEQAEQVEEAASASAAIISSYSTSPRTPSRPGRSPPSGISSYGNAAAGASSRSLLNDADWSPTFSNGRGTMGEEEAMEVVVVLGLREAGK